MLFIKVKNMFFVFFYLQINVFNIYGRSFSAVLQLPDGQNF